MLLRNVPYRKMIKFKAILLFLGLFYSAVGNAQEPPPVIKVNIDGKTGSMEIFLAKYKISTFALRDSIYSETLDLSKRENEDLIRNIEDDIIYLYIYTETILLPKKGDIIRFSLRERKSNSEMNVFIRLTHNMDFGEEFELTNLTFIPGDFFLDKCDSKKRYQINKAPLNQVDLTAVKKHKISVKKLNRIIKKHHCKG